MAATYHNEYRYNRFDEQYYEELTSRKWFVEKTLEVQTVADAVVLPFIANETREISWGKGGVVDSDGNYVGLSASMNFGRCEEDRMVGAYPFEKNDCDYIDEEVVYIGLIINHYGHLLVDCTNRLWFIIKHRPSCRIVYLPETRRQMHGAFEELMNIVGVEQKRLLAVTKPLRCKSVIIPERSEYPGKYWTREYKETFDYIRDQVPADTRYEKIYFSRQRLMISYVKERGENEIVPLLKKAGYTILYPEQYTIREKIALMKGCKELATICGTTPFQLMFGCDNTKLTVFNKTYESNIFEFMIGDMRNLEVTYIDAFYSLFPTNIGQGPFIIWKNENVVRYFKDNYGIETTPSKYLHSYISWYLKHYFDFNPELRDNVNGKELYDYFRKPFGQYRFSLSRIVNDLKYMFVSAPYTARMELTLLFSNIRRKLKL